MRVKARWMNGIVEEAAKMSVKMPFERGQARDAIRARCSARPDALQQMALAS